MLEGKSLLEILRSKRFVLPYLLSFILLLLAVLWIVFIAPELKKIPRNFSYTANTLSFDNLFDESSGKFEGENISKTEFSYRVVASNKKFLTLRNIFKVSTWSNRPIISVERFLFVDPYTGKYVKVKGRQERSGYLFGPRNPGNSFEYWHVNYDVGAYVKFVEDEKINGLTVKRYQALLQADQTKNLTNLPGVPLNRGILTKANLQLWIEPVSGWLVKVQDNSVAYYYDKKTGILLHPWNKFSNVYTENSIRQQVYNARLLKWKILAIDYIVPAILILLAIIPLWWTFKNKGLSDYFADIQHFFGTISNFFKKFLLLLISVFIVWSILYIFVFTTNNDQFVIGISQWNDNPDIVRIIQGFKNALAKKGFIEGKNITYIVKNPEGKIENQIAIIQYFLDKKVNLIFAATTPGALVAKSMTDSIPIVFADVLYPVQAGLVESLKSSGNNLVGLRNYLSPPEQFNMFEKLYPNLKKVGFVHRKGDPDSELLFQEFQAMLRKRNIDLIDVAAVDIPDLQQKIGATHYDALYIACDSLMQNKGLDVVTQYSVQQKIPIFACNKDAVLHGALISYSADMYTLGELSGDKAALILRGAEPAWLDTDSPTYGYLILNKDTAETLGVKIPDKMIEDANYIAEKY